MKPNNCYNLLYIENYSYRPEVCSGWGGGGQRERERFCFTRQPSFSSHNMPQWLLKQTHCLSQGPYCWTDLKQCWLSALNHQTLFVGRLLMAADDEKWTGLVKYIEPRHNDHRVQPSGLNGYQNVSSLSFHTWMFWTEIQVNGSWETCCPLLLPVFIYLLYILFVTTEKAEGKILV